MAAFPLSPCERHQCHTGSKQPFPAGMLLFSDCAAPRPADNADFAGYTEVIGWNVASPARAAELSHSQGAVLCLNARLEPSTQTDVDV